MIRLSEATENLSEEYVRIVKSGNPRSLPAPPENRREFMYGCKIKMDIAGTKKLIFISQE